MHFTELTPEEFNNFVIKQPTNNFFQSIFMYDRYKALKKECYLVGIINDINEIIGATLLVVTGKFLGSKIFEAIKGYILDYNYTELVDIFTEEIIIFIKKHGGFKLTIDPYIEYISRDIEGNEVKNNIDNKDIKNHLEKIGFRYLGELTQVKWIFTLNINGKTSDELFTGFKQNHRNLINRTMNKIGLIIKELSYDELPIFKKITEETCQRKDFSDRSLEYYQNMVKYFGSNIKVLVAYLHCDNYLLTLNTDIAKLNEEVIRSEGNKKKELESQLKTLGLRKLSLEKIKSEKGNIIPISGAMFMLYGNEVVYLFSGSYEEYMDYYGQYRLQWEMIKYAADNNYQRYNFYGIKDFKDKTKKDYGIYEFKKGFNGQVVELMGVFEIGTGLIYSLYKLLKK